ncbi:MAG: hypothetical protein ACC619_05075 [Paracoccaceae bacterium]
MRGFFIILALVLPFTAFAQERDSVFSSYQAYGEYVDELIMKRDFIPLIQTLGGRDEYTKEQLAGVNVQLMAAFPVKFKNRSVFREVDLGAGMRQEARVYWTGESYAFFYALLHQRANDIVVVNFNLNSSSAAVMSMF